MVRSHSLLFLVDALPMEQLSPVLSRDDEVGTTPGGLPAPLLTVHRDGRLARVYSPWGSPVFMTKS